MMVNGSYQQELDFYSRNSSLFVENMFCFARNLLIVPGARLESLSASAEGRAGYASDGKALSLPSVVKKRKFLIAGLGLQYNLHSTVQFYSNITQAYRPIQFSNMQSPPTTDSIDEMLTDAKGYNADVGIRGTWKIFCVLT